MTGGLMQLVAYGAQDVYLTGNPVITYFKVVYRRHTNFATESIQQTFTGNAQFGSRVSALVARSGDLISGVMVEAVLPKANANERYVDDVGHHLIQQVDIDIGGQLIDRHYADWLEIWAQLTVPAGHEVGYRKMIGQSQTSNRELNANTPSGLQSVAGTDAAGAQSDEDQDRKVYVPLQFWFCRNVGLALPLIALQYHEVKITVTFAQASHVLVGNVTDTDEANNDNNVITLGAAGTNPTSGNLEASLWVDYIYLDTDERRRFAQVSHEYLIEQLQFTGDETYTSGATNANVTLNFNHPVKELVWVCKENSRTPSGQALVNGANVSAAINFPTGISVNEHSNYTNVSSLASPGHDAVGVGGEAATAGVSSGLAKNPTFSDGQGNSVIARNPVTSAKLQLNSHDRMATRGGNYFNLMQTRCHTRIPQSPGINVFSFALKPEDHQPSGSCNFSRIDSARLQLTLIGGLTGGVIKVFATNYNVLRIMSGMGGLAYSN
jgi:hypothetical protein